MRVLVTGANGFVGGQIAAKLVEAGNDVRLLVRKTSRLDGIRALEVERVFGDVREPASLLKAASGAEVVVHSAGLTSALTEKDYYNVNARGTNAMISASVLAGVRRFVYVSSLAAQGPSPDGEVEQPDVEPHPTSPYGRSKLAGERYAQRAIEDMSIAIVRPPVIYGPRDRGLLPLFKLVKYRLMPLYGDGMNRLSLIHISDAADAIAQTAVAEGPSGSIYTVSDGGIYTWQDLVEHAKAGFGHSPLRIKVHHALYSAAGRAGDLAGMVLRKPLPLNSHKVREMAQKNWICDNQRIEAELGWQPHITAEEGLPATIQWYRDQGWL
jgi:nucleoside-diphosphate-sugar epimerase